MRNVTNCTWHNLVVSLVLVPYLAERYGSILRKQVHAGLVGGEGDSWPGGSLKPSWMGRGVAFSRTCSSEEAEWNCRREVTQVGTEAIGPLLAQLMSTWAWGEVRQSTCRQAVQSTVMPQCWEQTLECPGLLTGRLINVGLLAFTISKRCKFIRKRTIFLII